MYSPATISLPCYFSAGLCKIKQNAFYGAYCAHVAMQLHDQKSTQTSSRKKTGIALKSTETSSSTKVHALYPYFNCTIHPTKVGMHSFWGSFQLLNGNKCTNTENSKIFAKAVSVLLYVVMQLLSANNRKHAAIILHRQDDSMAMIWWMS